MQCIFRAVTSMWCSLVFSLASTFLSFVAITYLVTVAVYIESLGTINFSVELHTAYVRCNCTDNKFQLISDEPCDPEEFNNYCKEDGQLCFRAGCNDEIFDEAHWYRWVFRFINFFGFFQIPISVWAFEKLVVEVIFGTWYWTSNKSEVNNLKTLKNSIYLIISSR